MKQLKSLEIERVRLGDLVKATVKIEQMICKLIGTIVKAAISETAFRYFCPARISAKFVNKIFDEGWEPTFDETEGKNDFSDLDILKIDQDLDGLTVLAAKMMEYLDFNSPGGEAYRLNESDRKRASLTSPGSIPFMLVYSDEDRLVYFRRNVELVNRKTVKSQHIANDFENMRTRDLPLFVTDNGRPVPGHLRESTLKDVVPDNDLRKKLFGSKWITQLHVEISGYQTLYEFDFIDYKLTMDPSRTIEPRKLRDLAGVYRREDWCMKNGRHFSQEDIIISFFFNVLFSGFITHCECEEWEKVTDCEKCVKRLQGFENWNDM